MIAKKSTNNELRKKIITQYEIKSEGETIQSKRSDEEKKSSQFLLLLNSTEIEFT